MWPWRLLIEARQDDLLDARRRSKLDMASTERGGAGNVLGAAFGGFFFHTAEAVLQTFDFRFLWKLNQPTLT